MANTSLTPASKPNIFQILPKELRDMIWESADPNSISADYAGIENSCRQAKQEMRDAARRMMSRVLKAIEAEIRKSYSVEIPVGVAPFPFSILDEVTVFLPYSEMRKIVCQFCSTAKAMEAAKFVTTLGPLLSMNLKKLTIQITNDTNDSEEFAFNVLNISHGMQQQAVDPNWRGCADEEPSPAHLNSSVLAQSYDIGEYVDFGGDNPWSFLTAELQKLLVHSLRIASKQHSRDENIDGRGTADAKPVLRTEEIIIAWDNATDEDAKRGRVWEFYEEDYPDVKQTLAKEHCLPDSHIWPTWELGFTALPANDFGYESLQGDRDAGYLKLHVGPDWDLANYEYCRQGLSVYDQPHKGRVIKRKFPEANQRFSCDDLHIHWTQLKGAHE
ncbi:hypothetical protein M011DRAFT_459643 [Sporormia fimetaria CBS 119925]|uniref:Uncharacterized protein n=1 Tax=Sporormia fimetaria CBS 119925 TaxID=1340428 RepID=A0A6A6V6B7_9PLEO|nr:hypothetical protein M011DRAFT_459643 [Sporormia fimetaria CBS 119925]